MKNKDAKSSVMRDQISTVDGKIVDLEIRVKVLEEK
jgi:hypothetical protein